MDYGIGLRHLGRAFVDAQSLSPTAGDAAALGERLKQSLTLLPLLETSTMRQRAMFAWGDMEWQLAIAGESFDLVRAGTGADGRNLADFPAFARRAAEVLATTADYFGRVPHRMALVQEGLLREMVASRMDSLSKRFLQLPASFQNPAPFEWDWRCARHGTLRVGDVTEQTNVLATVKRFSGSMMLEGTPTTFDRIRVDLDVNTGPANTRGRFGQRELRQFFESAVQDHARLADEISAMLGAAE